MKNKKEETPEERKELIKKFLKFPELETEEEKKIYTCCGDEITRQIKDFGICPTCKEHI